MAKKLSPLPIDDAKEAFESALKEHRCVILEAPPGAGKTTRVPVWLLDLKLGNRSDKILVLEPRRIAARASAERVAGERGEAVGETIGYRVRFEERVGPKTRVEFITEGILTRRFQTDAFLEGVCAVVLDEVHERSVHTDLALGFLRELLEVRDDLFVVVMSATLDGSRLSNFMHQAPVVRSEGRAFPLEITYARTNAREDRPLPARASAAIFDLMQREDDDGGDILAFLPGAGEIERTREHLQKRLQSSAVDVTPLYGALPFAAQQQALRRGPRRRVVLATNIAETSMTVAGVTAVVDAGLRKVARFDSATGLDRLHVVNISKASAAQRAGRAGRVAPGRAHRLYSAVLHNTFARFDAPELSVIDLAAVALSLCAFASSDPAKFPLLDPLPTSTLDNALELLRMLGALEGESFALTPRGKALARFPTHPRIAALLLAGRANNLVIEATAMAAVLSEGDILTRQAQKLVPRHENDVLYRAELLDERSAPGLVDKASLLRARKVRTQLERLCKTAPKIAALRLPDEIERPLASLLLAGFPDRVCTTRADDKKRAVMVGRKGVKLGPETGVAEARLFVAPVLSGGAQGATRGGREGAREAAVMMAAELAPSDLELVMPHLVTRGETLAWDPQREAVALVRETRFVDLVLHSHVEGAPKSKDGGADDDERAQELVFEHAKEKIDTVMAWEGDTAQTLARIQFAKWHLKSAESDVESWPNINDKEWREQLLLMACMGTRSLAEVRKKNFGELALASMPWRLRAILDDKVPEKIEVPSGSKIAIDYAAAQSSDASPVLAVRLQEIFGWEQTPRVASVPLLLHLLAPNQRPVQVTQDLANFWDATYAEVRKELRRRYPRHAWPDDPRTEPAQRRPQRRRRR